MKLQQPVLKQQGGWHARQKWRSSSGHCVGSGGGHTDGKQRGNYYEGASRTGIGQAAFTYPSPDVLAPSVNTTCVMAPALRYVHRDTSLARWSMRHTPTTPACHNAHTTTLLLGTHCVHK